MATDLKRAIVDYAFVRQDEHATIGQIAAELGLSAWLLSKWLRHARLRLEKGKIPFEPGEFLSMPWLDPKEPAAEPSAAGSSPSQAEPAAAGSAPSSLLTGHTSGASPGPNPGQASTPRRIVIPATTLAEFLAGAVASHGSLHRAAEGIGVPYSTLRGWLKRRGGDAGEHGEAFRSAVTALRGHLDSAKQHVTALMGDVDAMGQRVQALEHLLGHERDAHG